MTRNEILQYLNGCEVLSVALEGTVMIADGKIIRNGEEIRATDDQVQMVWREYIGNEMDMDLERMMSNL